MKYEVLPVLVFQTDWTFKEGAVASTYGVVRSVSRDVEIFTATHEIPQFDIWSASYRLHQYVSFWPKGTVFVSVVDPGVGTDRKACVALTEDGYYIVTPDNGALTHLAATSGIAEVREIDETVNRLRKTEGTSVFHGRDLFGFCAAKLAAGIISYEEVGPSYDVNEIVKLPIHQSVCGEGFAEGIIEIDDPNFGNLWTNIPTAKLFEAGFAYGDDLHVTLRHNDQVIYERNTRFDTVFGTVEKGEPVIYNNELMNASLAVNQGSFLQQFSSGFGPEYTIRFEKKKEG